MGDPLCAFRHFGLVASTIARTGFGALVSYAKLITVLVGCMLFIALVVNPIIVWWRIRSNPYPLVLPACVKAASPPFFTRSSAANIPVNMALAKKLNLHEDTYSISIPLGATINMAGAAITITVLALAAAQHRGHHGGFLDRHFAQPRGHRQRLRRIRRGRRLAAADSLGVQPVRHFQ